MKEFVIILNARDLPALGPFRADINLWAAEAEGSLWVRGMEGTARPDPGFSTLPFKEMYWLDEKERMFPVGGVTPTGKLPELDWLPLSELLPVELPTSALPGQTAEKVPVRLVPSEKKGEGKALLVNLELWNQYAETAPQVRLKQLKFAVSEHGIVLVMGNPLPPLPGKEYWEKDQLLLPSGYDFEIPLMGSLIAHKLNFGEEAYLLFDVQGKWEKIPKQAFQVAIRSAVRLTREGGEDE